MSDSDQATGRGVPVAGQVPGGTDPGQTGAPAHPGGTGVHRIQVPHDAVGARQARRRLAAELERLVPPALYADVIAVAAELLGNAVRHADPLPGNVINVDWRIDTDATGTVVELRVRDGGSPNVPREREPGPDAVDGRGLAIVSALTRSSWGVERDGAGQCVWARLHHPRPGAARPGPA